MSPVLRNIQPEHHHPPHYSWWQYDPSVNASPSLSRLINSPGAETYGSFGFTARPSGLQGAPAVFWICSFRMRMLCLCSGGSMAICSGVSCSTCMIRAAWVQDRGRTGVVNTLQHNVLNSVYDGQITHRAVRCHSGIMGLHPR